MSLAHFMKSTSLSKTKQVVVVYKLSGGSSDVPGWTHIYMFGILKIWLIQLGCSVLARIQLMFDFIIQIGIRFCLILRALVFVND